MHGSDSARYTVILGQYFHISNTKKLEKHHSITSFTEVYQILDHRATTKFLLLYSNECAIMKEIQKGGVDVEQKVYPVDVISMCSASGEIRPLRLRLEDEDHQLLRIDIEEIISRKEIQYMGIEATVYLCRATVRGKQWLFELKYTIRSHVWSLFRKVL